MKRMIRTAQPLPLRREMSTGDTLLNKVRTESVGHLLPGHQADDFGNDKGG
jgi:hypothetical protein